MDHRRRSKRRLLEDKSSETILEQPAKRPKTIATTSAGVPYIDSLPPELVETIFGLLDVWTLPAARLVCTKFHDAASRRIRSVEISAETLRSQPEIGINTFPNLSRVSVCDVKEDDLEMLAQSPVGAAVTHLRASIQRPEPVWQLTQRPATRLTVSPLPNLTPLTVGNAHNRAISFPQTLRELRLTGRLTRQTADLVTKLTDLTCLQFDIFSLRKPFTGLTALTALHRLEISCKPSFVPFLAELTQLTHLRFLLECPRPADLGPLASLSRLQKLAHLGVGLWPALDFGGGRLGVETIILASIATITGLRSLDLALCQRPERSAFETVCMTPFTQLTALRLESVGLTASFLPRFNMEALQDLSLSGGVQLDRDGVAALRKATGLTRLDICAMQTGASMGPEELGIALSGMPRLRALSLLTRATSTTAARTTACFEAIGLLTELTRLEWNGRDTDTNGAVEVCVGLHKLRVLSIIPAACYTEAPDLSSEAVAPELFFDVAMLPELSTFVVGTKFRVSGWDLEGFVDDVRARLAAHRHDRGWAPLKLSLKYVESMLYID